MRVSRGCTPAVPPSSAFVAWHLLSLIRMLVIDLGPLLLQDELFSGSGITPAKAPFLSKARIPGCRAGCGLALSEAPPSHRSTAGLPLSALGRGWQGRVGFVSGPSRRAQRAGWGPAEGL